MFGMSMTEIMVILGIALVVLGPERLPKLARTIGRWVRQVRSAATDVRHALEYEDIRRESHEYMQKKDTPMSTYQAAATDDANLDDEYVPDDAQDDAGDLPEAHPPAAHFGQIAAEFGSVTPSRQITATVRGVFLDVPSPFEGFGVVIDRQEIPSVPVEFLLSVTSVKVTGGLPSGRPKRRSPGAAASVEPATSEASPVEAPVSIPEPSEASA